MTNPLVSIIIPVYNGSNFLEQSIVSALNQTYNNIEIIVVNDGSDDDGMTEKIAKSFGDKICYYYKHNGGVSSALNLGINYMKGDFFSWLSHDDLYHPDKIKKQFERLHEERSRNVIVFSDSDLINERGTLIRTIKPFSKDSYSGKEMFKLLISGLSLNGCTLLIPKNILLSAGEFDEQLHYIQDWKMWLNLSLNDISFLKSKGSLVSMRVHKNQQTNRIARLLPIEIEKVASELINILELQPIMQVDMIKSILLLSYRVNLEKIRRRCKSILNRPDLLSTKDRFVLVIQSIIEFVKGRLKFVLRKIHKYFVFFTLVTTKNK